MNARLYQQYISEPLVKKYLITLQNTFEGKIYHDVSWMPEVPIQTNQLVKLGYIEVNLTLNWQRQTYIASNFISKDKKEINLLCSLAIDEESMKEVNSIYHLEIQAAIERFNQQLRYTSSFKEGVADYRISSRK